MAKLTAIDLFCGAGGMSAGLKQAGFRVLAAIDVDPIAIESFEANHRGSQVMLCDIRSAKAAGLQRSLALRPGDLDLLAGCPPCQSFSTLKTLNGRRRVRDKGNKDLLFEMIKFVRVFEPKAIMLENVPRLAEDHRIQILAKRLRELGYVSRWKVLNAADYGVPQRRKRMILIAAKLKFGVPSFAAPWRPGRTVLDAIGSLPAPAESKDPLHAVPELRSHKIRKLISRIPKDGGSRGALPKSDQLVCHQKVDGFKDVYGRMAWDKVAPTITSGCFNPSKGRFLHPEANRCISLREAALLQGFPSNYRFALRHGKVSVARLIGNALPPPFIRRHSLSIRALISEH